MDEKWRQKNSDDNKIFFNEPSLTQQHFKKECDINWIVKQFKDVNGFELEDSYRGFVSGHFGDFSNVSDYQTALLQCKQANEAYENLPQKVKDKFGNRIDMFLNFVDDISNVNEMVELGLLKRLNEPVVEKVEEKTSNKGS